MKRIEWIVSEIKKCEYDEDFLNFLKQLELTFEEIHELELFLQETLFDKWIYDMSMVIKNINISLCEDLLIKTNNVSYIYYLALDNEKVNKEKLIETIIASNNPLYIFLTYLNIKPMKELEDALIKINDIEYIYYLALIKKGDITNLEDVIYSSLNPKYIYQLALNKKDIINLDRAYESLIKTKQSVYLYYFFINIKNGNSNEEPYLKAIENIINSDFDDLFKINIFLKNMNSPLLPDIFVLLINYYGLSNLYYYFDGNLTEEFIIKLLGKATLDTNLIYEVYYPFMLATLSIDYAFSLDKEYLKLVQNNEKKLNYSRKYYI